MPYLDRNRKRALVVDGAFPEGPGELNFLITQAVIRYCLVHGLSYRVINDVVGALEGAKLEFYRRVAAPYETYKVATNGDVYPPELLPDE